MLNKFDPFKYLFRRDEPKFKKVKCKIKTTETEQEILNRYRSKNRRKKK